MIIQRMGPVTYKVQVNDLIWKRHVDQLRDLNGVQFTDHSEEDQLVHSSQPVDFQVITTTQPPDAPETLLQITTDTNVEMTPELLTPGRERSGNTKVNGENPGTSRKSTRACKTPDYLKDYVTDLT